MTIRNGFTHLGFDEKETRRVDLPELEPAQKPVEAPAEPATQPQPQEPAKVPG